MSRGLPYEFVVSRIIRSTNTDATPMQASEDGKLTLMTCAGVFNPITQDYSERLWVIAEAPDKAKETIAQVSATATVEARIAAAATATAFAAIPTPTPYTGEPSLAGGPGQYARGPGQGPRRAARRNAPQAGRVPAVGASTTCDSLPIHRAPRCWSSSRMARPATDVRCRRARLASVLSVRCSSSAVEPEGNAEFVVERFESPTLEEAVDSLEFSVIYLRDRQGLISHVILGLGGDVDALIDAASQT